MIRRAGRIFLDALTVASLLLYLAAAGIFSLDRTINRIEVER